MSQSGLKEPGQINVSKIGERLQRKLENLRNYYTFKTLALSAFPNQGLICKRSKQLRYPLRSSQPFLRLSVSKIEQSFQISSELELNEEITLSKSTRFYFEHVVDFS